MEHALTVSSVYHSFGRKQILSDVALTCRTGEVLAIFGRNGSGKSTLLKILFGTLKPDKASIHVNGEKIADKNNLNQFIGYHHQEVFLPKNTTVRNLIPLYFPDSEKQNKLFYEKQINRIEQLKVGALSPGEQRYLQFLFLLNLDHPFLMLDEPFSMLEPLYKDLVKEKIESYRASKGFIITDHYYADILQIATRKMVLVNAQLQDIKTNEELIEVGYLSSNFRNRI